MIHSSIHGLGFWQPVTQLFNSHSADSQMRQTEKWHLMNDDVLQLLLLAPGKELKGTEKGMDFYIHSKSASRAPVLHDPNILLHSTSAAWVRFVSGNHLLIDSGVVLGYIITD